MGRISIERVNAPFLAAGMVQATTSKPGIERAVALGWLWRHQSRTANFQIASHSRISMLRW
jgi:hypothetical protein